VAQSERRGLAVGWAAMLGVTAAALLVALVVPVAGLAMLVLTGPGDHVARLLAGSAERSSRRGPTGRSRFGQ
jgi:hypothetical protein